MSWRPFLTQLCPFLASYFILLSCDALVQQSGSPRLLRSAPAPLLGPPRDASLPAQCRPSWFTGCSVPVCEPPGPVAALFTLRGDCWEGVCARETVKGVKVYWAEFSSPWSPSGGCQVGLVLGWSFLPSPPSSSSPRWTLAQDWQPGVLCSSRQSEARPGSS